MTTTPDDDYEFPFDGYTVPQLRNAIAHVRDRRSDEYLLQSWVSHASDALDLYEAEKARADKLAEWVEGAYRFIESSLVIAARSCRPGDGLDRTWAHRLMTEAEEMGLDPQSHIQRIVPESEILL